jgi:CRP-like cAMP-binding protein
MGKKGMPATAIATVPWLPNSRFLKGLGARDLDRIKAAAKPRRYMANAVITNQSAPGDHLYLLTSGRARHFYLTPEGKKTLLLWLTPGDIFGGVAFLSEDKDYLLSTEAVSDSSVLVWDRGALRELAGQYPKLAENALSIASDYLVWYLADHIALISHGAHQRLAQVLICLAKTIGQQTRTGVEFDVTNEDLASAANLTPFTVSRILSQWQAGRAIVKRRGKLVLRSAELLLLNTR